MGVPQRQLELKIEANLEEMSKAKYVSIFCQFNLGVTHWYASTGQQNNSKIWGPRPPAAWNWYANLPFAGKGVVVVGILVVVVMLVVFVVVVRAVEVVVEVSESNVVVC